MYFQKTNSNIFERSFLDSLTIHSSLFSFVIYYGNFSSLQVRQVLVNYTLLVFLFRQQKENAREREGGERSDGKVKIYLNSLVPGFHGICTRLFSKYISWYAQNSFIIISFFITSKTYWYWVSAQNPDDIKIILKFVLFHAFRSWEMKSVKKTITPTN